MRSFGTWEHGPLAIRCPTKGGANSKSENNNMCQSKVTLTGFLGSDLELRNNRLGRFTTLCVATKSSYRKDEAYVSHTEWHRCVVFGKLSDFAATLRRGTHLQVEGELRSCEYVNPKAGSAQRVLENSCRCYLEARSGGKNISARAAGRGIAAGGGGHIGRRSSYRKPGSELGLDGWEDTVMRSESIVSFLRPTESLRLNQIMFLTSGYREVPGRDECRPNAPQQAI